MAFSRTLVVSFLAFTIGSAAPATAYLRLHPENPRYLQETTTGKPVLIASVTAIVPSAKTYDWKKGLSEIIEQKLTYSRVWHLGPWSRDQIWPWAYSDVPAVGFPANKVDMEKWNPEYWNRMREAMDRANKGGVYAEIHFFDRCGMSPESRYKGNPWASDNNVNNLEMPTCDKDGTPDFYMYDTKPNLHRQQDRYVTKMIDETIEFSNVIYEIENEHWQHDKPDWVAHWAKFTKDYVAKNYPKSPRLVAYSSLEDDLEACYTMPEVDIVNPHFGNKAEEAPGIMNDYIEPRWAKKKAINVDEFANGLEDPKVLRIMCWTIITSGAHFHIEDATPKSKPYEIVENLRQFKLQSGWDFVHSAPNKKLIVTGNGYCMARPGVEYVAFFPEGGSASITMPKGKYTARWWSTTANEFQGKHEFSHKGGVKALVAPDKAEWVLQIRAGKISSEF